MEERGVAEQQLLQFVLADVCGLVSQGSHINKLELFLLEVAMGIFRPNKDSLFKLPPKTDLQRFCTLHDRQREKKKR